MSQNNNNNKALNWEEITKAKTSKFKKELEVTKKIETNKLGYISKAVNILEKIENSVKNRILKDEEIPKHGDLIKLTANPDILRIAYTKLSKNKGAMTPGTKGLTADSIGEKTIQKISNQILTGNYKWNPVKRIFIPKPGKSTKRPLGLPDFNDKIVQEAIRMTLEVIYEPLFAKYDLNSGFRPKRDCAHAIRSIRQKAQFSTYAIEGDIKGAYDNVNHKILIKILSNKIKDKKFLRLIWTGLKAGIMEDLTFTDSFIGVPQGGIASPILFNIYMHNFDFYMYKMTKETNENEVIKINPEYAKLKSERDRKKNKIKFYEQILSKDDITLAETKNLLPYIRELLPVLYNNDNMFPEIKWINKNKIKEMQEYFNQNEDVKKNAFSGERATLRRAIKKNPTIARRIIELYLPVLKNHLIATQRKKSLTTYTDTKKSSNKIYYHRYADDFVIWLRGDRNFAIETKEKVKQVLADELKLELSPEKTLITDVKKNKVKFLGFEIFRHRHRMMTKDYRGINKSVRTTGIKPDQKRLETRFLLKGFIKKNKLGKLIPSEIGWLTPYTDQQIIKRYNQIMLGFGLYYSTEISQISDLNRWIYYMYWSCIKTLATKHKITVKQVINRYGYKDISLPETKTQHRSKMAATDLRITAKYIIDNKPKYETLLNYKELMYIHLIPHRKRYRKKIKEEDEPELTEAINFSVLHKINARTTFKLTHHCTICGATNNLQMHHIRPLKVKGVLGAGYKGFDKIIGALNRKQIPVCSQCHQNIHKGTYNSIGLNELYDIRLSQAENYIANFPNTSAIKQLVKMGKKYTTVEYVNKTYYNQLYLENKTKYGKFR